MKLKTRLRMQVDRELALAALSEATSFVFAGDDVSPERLREIVRILLSELSRTSESATQVLSLATASDSHVAAIRQYEGELARLRDQLESYRDPAAWEE